MRRRHETRPHAHGGDRGQRARKKNKPAVGQCIELNTAWYIFYGIKFLNMGRQEVMVTSVGEMQDLIACLNIFNGAAPKQKPVPISFLQQMEVD